MHTGTRKCKMAWIQKSNSIAALLLLAVSVQMTGTAATCSFNSRLEKASVLQDPGHYFDFDHRLACAGDIVAWYYCYYAVDLAAYANAYWIRFQVWREIENTRLLHIHSHHLHLETLPSNESFVCQREVVSEPIPVEAGDFLGVNLPLRIANPIPVIGQGLPGSVLYRDIGNSSIIHLNREEGLVLHVDAEIVASSSNTTSPQPTASEVTVTPSAPISYAKTSSVNMQRPFSVVLPAPSDLTRPIEQASGTIIPSASHVSVLQSRGSTFSNSEPNKIAIALSSPTTAAATIIPTAVVEQPSSEGAVALNWPFISGITIGAVLLVLIVIVSVLLFLVCVRRRENPNKSVAAELDTFTNREANTCSNQEKPLDRSPSSKALDTHKVLEVPISIDEHDKVDSCTVYDAPSKKSPTSNSTSGSACSIFSTEEGQHISSAQPYETPLVTPLGLRLNLFPSSSTLDNIAGAETLSKSPLHLHTGTLRKSPLHLQLNHTETLTLDRLRVLKAKKHRLKSALPDKESKECPVLVLSERPPKVKAPTPEAEAKKLERDSIGTDDEGYCTVGHFVTLLDQANIDTNIPSPQDMYCSPPNDERDILETLERMNVTNIPTHSIQIISHIGTGEFGSVAKAYWKNETKEIEVAVKSVSPDADIEERVKLLQEAAMMGQFRHPNVVQLHGIVTTGTSCVLVLGYLSKGDLRTHLVCMNRETLSCGTPKLLTSFSQQVALGMHYLASKGFVHRDLAARNIFVSENNTCKVGDFGMSRDLANASYYFSKGGKIPVRWTAPEAMYYHKYSTASDVWSYGCVLYEIWSLGRLPFKNYTNTQVLERLDSGHRLPPPPGTPRAVYDLMIQTWHPNARHRPEFRNILLQLVGDETRLLHIPVSDASTSQQASRLGSPLAAGEYMYSDLQRTYLLQQDSPQDEEQYDSLIGQKYVLSFPTSSADIAHLYNEQKSPQKSFRNQLLDTESDYEDLSGRY